MSSSNPNRGGRFGYQGSKDWINSSRSRRKNFYSSESTAAAAAGAGAGGSGSLPNSATATTSSNEATSTTPNLSRRDFKSNGPGSSSLTHSKDAQPVRNGSAYSSNYYSHSGYGSYDSSSYRAEGWRKTSGELRRSVGNQKPTLSGSSSGSLSSTSSPTSGYKNGRYDSYRADTNSYGSRWKSGRNFAASSTRYSAKDRIRNGKPSLSNSYVPSSNSVPLGASAANSYDSYSPSAGQATFKYESPKAYGSYYSSSCPEDKSSSLSQSRPPYFTPRPYKSRYGGSRYGGSTLINPVEKRAKEEELEGDQDSQNDYENNDDVDSISNIRRHDEDTQSEATENEERNTEIKERIGHENIDADQTQDDESLQAIEQNSVETSAEPESKDDLLREIYSRKARIETPPVVAEVESKVKIEYEETSAVDGSEIVYRYPLPEIPHKYEEMRREFQQSGGKSLKYLLAAPIHEFSDYTFFINNYEEFQKRKRDALVNILREKTLNVQSKTLDLSQAYKEMSKKWEERRMKMEQQLRVLHPPDDEMRRELDSSDMRKQNQQQASAGNASSTPTQVSSFDLPTVSSRRSSRRHGDLVTTEAEFQEILLTLGQEQEDPLLKADRVSANIPDMILDPVEKNEVKFMDANNIVRDKDTWASRVKTDFHNTFSEKEHALFTEAFCLFPKRFGAISRYMGGLRTASECVLHYYMTKKSVNYKQLLMQRRKASKKTKKTKSAGRPKSTPQPPIDQTVGNLEVPSGTITDSIQDVGSIDTSESTVFQTTGMPSVVESSEIQVDRGNKKRAPRERATEKRKQKPGSALTADGQKPAEKKRKTTAKKQASEEGDTKPAEKKKKRVGKKQAAEEALTSNVAGIVPGLNSNSKVTIGALPLKNATNGLQSELYTGSAPIAQQYVYQQQPHQTVTLPVQYSQRTEEQSSRPHQQYEQSIQFQQSQQQQVYAQYQAQYQGLYQAQSPSFAPQRSAPVFPSIRNLLSEQSAASYQQPFTPLASAEQQQQQQLPQQHSLPSYQQEVPLAAAQVAKPSSHRTSSIMNLLNQDEKPAAAQQQRAKTNLRDLLN
ncbi:SNT1 [Candida theae]|uniref:SNT1 n=1 Tax=Candida theae TaxID=1198502 RepID=A0AAD5BAK6_9ASCO|nr:SNT1 [Candida theae]KAI5949019.1 SNT1 [Candida theae]